MLCCIPMLPEKVEKYHIVRHLGSGAFSHVFLVKGTKTRKWYAMKRIELVSDEIKRMVKFEVETLQSVNHPNEMKLHDIFYSDLKEKNHYANLILQYA